MKSVVALGAPHRQGQAITAALKKVLGHNCRVEAGAYVDLEALLQTFINKFTTIINSTNTLDEAKQTYIDQHQQYFAT